MAIKHTFTSTKSDGGDSTLVRPTDWNADHTGESAGVVPVGGIIVWSGSIASIPSPYALCDGTANSPGPDLRDKFIVGAKQDDGGVAKSNIEGSLQVAGGVTGHLHSVHAALTHAGGAVGDHTGFTHSLAIGNHPDLTHVAIGAHAATTLTHPSHTHAGMTHADHSVASFTGSHASHTHSAATLGISVSSQGTARTLVTGSAAPGSAPSMTHTHAAITLTHASHPTFTGAADPDHSVASLTHDQVGTHLGTGYGTHAITQPADHGTAGTVTHSFTQPDVHTISAHDTVSNVPTYYALAFIQRMS